MQDAHWRSSSDGQHPSGSVDRSIEKTTIDIDSVHIPDFMMRDFMLIGEENEWEENVSSLFEWVGMACLCSPR